MAPLDTDAQFKFLIACIKFSKDGKVATECEIVSKGAAAKRYERLMKAHGIAGNSGGARAGSSGPSEPSTPANRRTQPASRASSNKKRKLAARGDDLDDKVKPEVKPEAQTEVKAERKQEATALNDSDSSYMLPPSDPHEATACACVVSGESYKSETPCGDDEVLLVSGSPREYNGTVAPTNALQQILMPPPPDGFYGFIDHASDMHLLSPISHPFAHEHDADYLMQTMTPSEPAARHWLQHHQNPPFF